MGMSPQLAELVHFWAGWALVVSLVAGVLATFLHIESGAVKEAALQRELAVMHERAAASELRTEELRRELGPRQLNREAFIAALRDQPKAPVEIMYFGDDAECMHLAQSLEMALREANWDVLARAPIPRRIGVSESIAMRVGGQPSGVTVVVATVTAAEADATGDRMAGREWTRTPFTVLIDAVGAGLGRAASHASGPNSPPDGRLRIVVAPR